MITEDIESWFVYSSCIQGIVFNVKCQGCIIDIFGTDLNQLALIDLTTFDVPLETL
jgi:hypothetical protein